MRTSCIELLPQSQRRGYAQHLLADSCWLEDSPGINLRRLFKKFGKCISFGALLCKAQNSLNLSFQTALRESEFMMLRCISVHGLYMQSVQGSKLLFKLQY